jgi:glutamyl-tRNA synthetase
VTNIVSLVRERANFVNELWGQSSFFFVDPTEYDAKTIQKRWKAETPAQMNELCELLSDITNFTPENTEEVVKEWIASKEYSLGGIMNAFRLSIVGEPKGPHMFDITAVIGKEETIKRLKKAIEVIG